ncbi:MAG TPA: FHA domain-containing protein [Verrucomicrobiae bacterium]
MVKLVILNQGMTGRTFEVNDERTTVGRVEDNAFQIADPSVSSRHAEFILRGPELLIRDLNSTNGTFINGEKISEAVLLSGQTVRFGQVEIKIDDGKPVVPPAPASAPPPPPKKQVESTMVMPRGVSLTDLEQSGARVGGFDTNASFSKKSNKANKYFIIVGLIVGVVIVGLIIYALMQAGGGANGTK